MQMAQATGFLASYLSWEVYVFSSVGGEVLQPAPVEAKS